VPTDGNWKLGLSLALVTTAMWATLPIAASLALAVLDPFTLTWVRFLFAAVATAVFVGSRSGWSVYRGLKKSTWAWLALASVLLVGNYVLYLVGLNYTTPATAQVLIQSAPLLLGVGGLIFFGERFSGRQWLGLGAMVTGLAVYSAVQLSGVEDGANSYALGALIVLISGVSWAGYALVQKRMGSRLGSQAILLAIYVVGTFALLPASEPAAVSAISGTGAAAVLYCCINTVLAYGAFARSVEVWDATRVSAVVSTTPFFTMLIVTIGGAMGLLPSEPLPPAAWAAAVLVVAGSATVSLSGR